MIPMTRALAALFAVLVLAACTSDPEPGPILTPTPTPVSTAPSSPAATTTTDLAPLTVDTTSGRLEGLTQGQTRAFLSVRYAKPPTGQRRWTDPEPGPKATGMVDARKPGARCAQGATATEAVSTSEDCLFLNVTTPSAVKAGQKLPVMVWWHGGGYTSGAGSDYDAGRLAERGRVVVVTVNYRLGVFGYLSLPGLKGSGDFGLADQILATRWARQNAAAFGGDPGNVTVFGESSGAMSACALLTSPAAKGLVDKVALSSGGSCRLSWPDNGVALSAPAQTPYASLAVGEKLGVGQARKVGCPGADVASCLRGKTTKDLLKISGRFFDVLAYGTDLLPRNPAEAVLKGQTLAVPVLSSVNRHEARAFVGAEQKAARSSGPVFTDKTYPGYVAAAYPGHETEVLRQYPLEKFASPALAWSALITDGSWACPTRAGDTTLAQHGSPVFAAEFADPDAPDVNRIASATFDPAAAHGSDLPYLFDLAGRNALKSRAQTGLADTMIDYWSSFARSGTPTAEGAPRWPAFTGAGGPTLSLRPGDIAPIDFGAEHHCDFWAALGS